MRISHVIRGRTSPDARSTRRSRVTSAPNRRRTSSKGLASATTAERVEAGSAASLRDCATGSPPEAVKATSRSSASARRRALDGAAWQDGGRGLGALATRSWRPGSASPRWTALGRARTRGGGGDADASSTLPSSPRCVVEPSKFRELRAAGAAELDKDEAKAILRELKAVGGDLRSLRLALTGAGRGPELWTILVALSRDEALRRAGATSG